MRGRRRRFSGEQKAKIALEALRGDRTLQEIAAGHQVHPSQVGAWKRQAIGGLERNDLHAVDSRIGMILEHLLEPEHSPAGDPRDGWFDTVVRCRDDISRTLDDSPSLRRKLPERWLKDCALARRRAVRGLVRDGIGTAEIPADPPCALDQALDPDWWPANRHDHGLPGRSCMPSRTDSRLRLLGATA